METLALISMNVKLVHVMSMQPVLTQMEATHVSVVVTSLEVDLTAYVSILPKFLLAKFICLLLPRHHLFCGI